MTPSREITRRTALGLIAAGALAGCGLGTDSTVRPGLKVDGEPPAPLNRIPNRPEEGATPEEIILGFLHAGATSGERLEITRSYLTDTLARAWLPDSQTVIYDGGEPEVTAVEGTEATYRTRVHVRATIDSEGRYTVAPPNLWEVFSFTVEQVEGEWRIDQLQDGFGRLLQQHEVGFIFRDYPVHYPAIGWNALVVDQRWFPQDQLATRLVRAQLGRVPDYLEDAVSTDIGAKLVVDAVPVRDGVAQVDLDVDSVATDATTRKKLAAQLVATLMTLPGVTEVVITLSGKALDLGVEAPLTTPEQLGFVDRGQTSAPIVLGRRGTKLVKVGDRLAAVSEQQVRSASSAFAPVPKDSRRLALRLDGKEVAAVDADGRVLTRYRDDGSSTELPAFAADMCNPCYDYGGVLWLGGSGLGREIGHRIWAVNATVDPDDEAAEPQHIPTPWLGRRLVQAAVVSPEGSRLAVISEEVPGAGSTLEIVGIARQANGLPTTTSPQTFRQAADLVQMLDAVWVDQSTLAVIGRRDKQAVLQPYLVHVGGEVEQMAERPGTVRVTTTGDDKDIVLTSAGDRVFQRTGGRWQRISALTGVVAAGL